MPTIAEMFDLAARHHQSGNLAQAEPLYRQVLQADFTHVDAHNNLGLALKEQGRLDEAIECFRQALRLSPNHANVRYNLGNILFKQGQLRVATECYRQALAINPNYVEAHNNLGGLLFSQGQLAEAAECYRQALAINPNHLDAHNNLGSVLIRQGRLTEAAECYRQALRINPNHVDAYNNMGAFLFSQGQLAEAAEFYGQALRIDPANKLALWNRSLLRLLQGDFQGGWPDYELRWVQPGKIPRSFQQPRWNGAPLEGKTILVYAEQGLGDTIQFLRYLPMIKSRGGRVLFECPPDLLSLLTGFPGVDQIVAMGAPWPPYDVQVPLLSLPGVFQTTLATIPAAVPYLKADPEKVVFWRKELKPLEGLKVGIAWQGNPKFNGDPLRSIPLKFFEPLARMPGVRLVSLQKGTGTDQLHALEKQFPILDLSERLHTFSDTAAVMKNLDLIVSSCTSVPHLAGALGAPVWTVLQFAPDWRWLLGRQDSPWYPTMRLFRQSKPGAWGDVFERIAAEVKNRSQENDF